MPGYFTKIKSIKRLIKDQIRYISILLGVIARNEKRLNEVEQMFASTLTDPNLPKDPDHPMFEEVAVLKRNIKRQIGEIKYLIYACKQDLVYIRRRIRIYRSLMIPYIS